MNNLDELIKKLKKLEDRFAPHPIDQVKFFCKNKRNPSNAVPFFITECIMSSFSQDLDGMITQEKSRELFNNYIQPLIECLKNVYNYPEKCVEYLSDYITNHLDK